MSRRYTILVVEDDADLRGMFRAALALAGFDVRDAADGWEALRRVDIALPDLIVLDLGLPGVNGQGVLAELSAQAHTRAIPVVVVTASSDPLQGFQVDCVLRKPVDPDELLRAVRRCLAANPEAQP